MRKFGHQILVPITDKKLVRDIHSRALLSNDTEAFDAYRDRKRASMRVDELEAQVKETKETMKEIKNMLSSVLSNMNYGNRHFGAGDGDFGYATGGVGSSGKTH